MNGTRVTGKTRRARNSATLRAQYRGTRIIACVTITLGPGSRLPCRGPEAGGKDNGGPGPRKGYAAYAAFVIDPDGNNVEAVIWEGEPGASNETRPSKSGGRKKKRR